LEQFNNVVQQKGNVVRRFHGTSQCEMCLFGCDQSRPPCMSTSCRVCGICRTGFELKHVARGAGGQAWSHQTQRLRYGEGMYFSPASSKSNDYNDGSERMRPGHRGERRWRSMFLCSVVLGRSSTTTEGFLGEGQCPPPGYDSVVGLPGGQGPDALNYEECVVYSESQAIPSYLIVYSL
jgi:hypothetical protein